jgi:hypothetical protein
MSRTDCQIKFLDIRHNILMDNQLKVLLSLLNTNKAIEEIEYTVTDEKNIERKEDFKDDRADGQSYD